MLRKIVTYLIAKINKAIVLTKLFLETVKNFDWRIYSIQLYIVRTFIITFFFVSIVLTLLGTFFTLLMDINWFLNSGVLQKKFWTILKIYSLRSPNIFHYLAPLCVLISVSYIFANLSKKFELVAVVTSGMSLRQLFYPLIALGAFLTVAFFFFNDRVMTYFIKEARVIERREIWEEKYFGSQTFRSNITIPVKSQNPQITYRYIGFVSSDGMISNFSITKFFDPKDLRISFVEKKFEGGLVQYYITANYGFWRKNLGNWELFNVEITELNQKSEVISKKKLKKYIPSFKLDTPDYFFPMPFEFTSLSLEEMKRELSKSTSYYFTFANEDYYQKLMLIFTRVSSSFTILISMLLSLGFVRIISQKFLFTTMVFKSILVYVIYYLFFLSGIFLGQNRILPSVLGAWIGNIIFIIYGFYLNAKLKT